jgi:hypothetical protein
MNKVTGAKKAAEANLIARREETANGEWIDSHRGSRIKQLFPSGGVSAA